MTITGGGFWFSKSLAIAGFEPPTIVYSIVTLSTLLTYGDFGEFSR